MERLLERAVKASDGYPPYNVEQRQAERGEALGSRWQSPDSPVTSFRSRSRTTSSSSAAGRTTTTRAPIFTAASPRASSSARSKRRDGIEVKHAHLENGLLMIDLEKPEPERRVRTIEISETVEKPASRRVERDAV